MSQEQTALNQRSNAVAYGRTTGNSRVARFTCVVEATTRDVIVLVPGTTDPVNSIPGRNGADIGYWDESKNFKATCAAYKRAYCDTHILDTFAWNGDNSKEERKKSGIKLKEYLMNYYGAKSAKHETRFHLIGHSHGGNVINEFTQAIANDPSFPHKWKIKSITYLSTPFFKTLHPLKVDTDKLHPDCQIINVFNEFDLTQRVVADFSMKQMGLLIEAFAKNTAFQKAKKTLADSDTTVYNALKSFFGSLTVEEGRAIWRTSLEALRAADTLLIETIRIFRSLNETHNYFITDKIRNQVLKLVDELTKLLSGPIKNLANRLEQDRTLNTGKRKPKFKYSRSDFLGDIELSNSIVDILKILNEYLFIDANLLGPFTQLLDDILLNQIDQFDNTTNSPEKQVKGKFPITHVPVKAHDRYNGQKNTEFARFIQDLERLETEYEANQTPAVRMKIVFSLLAQMDYSALTLAQNWVNLLSKLLFGKIDTELKILGTRLQVLQRHLDTRNRHIVLEADHDKPFIDQRGSLAYLAVFSHSVSRQELYPMAKSKLDSAIESIPMPGQPKAAALKLTLKSAG